MYRFLGILSCLIALSALNAREQSSPDAHQPAAEPQAAAHACPTTGD